MSGPMSDAHGSAVSAEPERQSRFVILSPAHPSANLTDAAALPFSSDPDKQSKVPREQDFAASDVSDDDPVATEDEVRQLLHVVDRIPVRLWVACLAGILERFVWYGATAPLQNYLQNAPGGEVPGALGLGQATASNIVNVLIIASYITPVPAAIIADSWLGRYKTMLYSAIIEAIGATILCATSFPAVIERGAGLGGLVAACALMAIGSGAFKTTVVPFIADQYDESELHVRTQKDGKKVVTSRTLTITYIYNVFYWGVNMISFLADCTPLLERHVGFWLAYLIPCCAMWLALLPILLGRSYFIQTSPTSNIMPQVAAALRHGIAGGFQMDAAKPSNQLNHGRQVPWTDTFIDEIKRSLLTCRVLLLFPIHWLCYNQTFNNLISQAAQMTTYNIPNDMIKISGPIAGILVAPLIQKALYPYLTRHAIPFGPIARITTGFAILTLSMAYTAVVQKLIYSSGPCYDRPLACEHAIPNHISVFLQIPVYVAGALAEVFCMTTGTEYAYTRAPDGMKTLVQAVWLGMAGVGTALALAFTPLTRDPELVVMYGILAGLMGGATGLFWVVFRRLDRDE